ncbi:helix-turn-helix domain-containing protein [Pseudodesulfovibrio sp.]|uniref:helix-turn-helix domain-containing protein n=1 Tax=unclassified Pseudodesulfovibrio TaxID=2661612 RepID=UPI003B0010D6
MNATMDSYRINERAWELIMGKIHQKLAEGMSQSAISQLLGVKRPTVSRWLADRRGGDKTPFRDMVHYLDRLRIPLRDVFAIDDDSLPPPSPDRAPTELDKAIADTLVIVAKAVGKDIQDVARTLESLDLPDIQVMMKGREAMKVSDFLRICRAIGVSPEAVLSRAEALSHTE